MHINERTALSTSKVLLVPYEAHHVPTYHNWMQRPELQTATASEPLSLQEEYAMQKSWRTDNDKLTFIICNHIPQSTTPDRDPFKVGRHDGPEDMIGDINLFLFHVEHTDEDLERPSPSEVVGEIELMIALAHRQNAGLGRAALVTFLQYVLEQSPKIASGFAGERASFAYLRARIHKDNVRSLGLFESIGFQRTADGANFFGEVELRWRPGKEFLREVKGFEEARELEYCR